MSTSNNNTMLTKVENYDTDRMVFSEPVSGSIPDSIPKIEFKRINIGTTNPDGTVGDLVIGTERLFSFGVSENKSMETGRISGYVMPLCLWSRDGATEMEKAFTETFTAIVEKCKDHLIENREEIDQFEMVRSDLRKFNPLYYKKEKVVDSRTKKTVLKVVEGTGPTLYAKLIFSKKNDKFVTTFFDSVTGMDVDPLTLLGKYCYARAAVKVESIFIGNKISLQVKIYECEVQEMQSGRPRLFDRPKPVSNVVSLADDNDNANTLLDDDDAGSLNGDVEDTPPEKTVSKKRVVKRKVKRVSRKTK